MMANESPNKRGSMGGRGSYSPVRRDGRSSANGKPVSA